MFCSSVSERSSTLTISLLDGPIEVMISFNFKCMASVSLFWDRWIRNTIRNVTIDEAVFMTSCQVSDQRNTGPVTAQMTMIATAKTNADGRPVAIATLPAARSKNRLIMSRPPQPFQREWRERPDAVFVGPDPFFTSRRVQLVNLASRHAVPATFSNRDFAEVGGLISYGANPADALRQVGVYAGRMLKGTKPADLPVVQASKLELVINAQTARTIGLTVPDKLLALADEVIE